MSEELRLRHLLAPLLASLLTTLLRTTRWVSYDRSYTRGWGSLRSRSGIVYPLLPRAQRPDTNVVVDAALPEPAAVRRQDLPPTIVEIGSTSSHRHPLLPGDALPGSPPENADATALQRYSGHPNAHHPVGIGVIEITP